MKEKEALKRVKKNMEKAMKAVKETAKKEREKKEKVVVKRGEIYLLKYLCKL